MADRITKQDKSVSCNLLPVASCYTPLATSTPVKDAHYLSDDSKVTNASLYDPINDSNSDSTFMESAVDVTTELWQSQYLLVSRGCLWELLQTCPTCSRPCSVDIVKTMGTFISVDIRCSRCCFTRQWKSQPMHGNVPAGNILLAAVIHFNGASPTKTFRIFDTLNVPRISYSTYWKYQTSLLQPVVWSCWLER